MSIIFEIYTAQCIVLSSAICFRDLELHNILTQKQKD